MHCTSPGLKHSCRMVTTGFAASCQGVLSEVSSALQVDTETKFLLKVLTNLCVGLRDGCLTPIHT